MENNSLKCTYESPLNCVSTDGNAVLAGFGFDRVNIHENLAVRKDVTEVNIRFNCAKKDYQIHQTEVKIIVIKGAVSIFTHQH